MAAPGCIITTTDDGTDDAVGDASSGGDEPGEESGQESGDESPATDGGADETGSAEGGSADGPLPGTWLYTETGETTNDCTFLEDPSNGWGEYEVVQTEGGFQIIPGDDTDPIACTAGGGSFDCPERLQDVVEAGGSSLQVFVTIDGTLPAADEMAGAQLGEVVCEGADCAVAEQLLGTSFPCSFSIGFTGERLG
ncbi:MAG: hypothetical protein AB1Z98_27595 [Nannocystaceae bacterium]